MKCESAQENIALAAWGELPDEQRLPLEQHLTNCESCRSEYEAVQGLVKAMSLLPVEEPSANLLTRARLRLEEALDALPPESLPVRLVQRFSLGLSRLRSAPIAATVLLLMGLGFGAYGGYRAGARVHDATQKSLILHAAQQSDTPGKIANVSGIAQDPNSGDVVVHYNRLVPDSIQGPLSDPQIQQLLLLGVRNPATPDVRYDSVGLLADACRVGNMCSDDSVRNALMVALLYDRSPSVRMKALDGLQPYVGEDMQVRDAVLEVLMNDPDAHIRADAVGLLAPVEADSSVREVLHTAATQDTNAHIRDVSQQVLSSAPPIQ